MSSHTGEPLRVGVMGLGLMGRRMLGSLRQHPSFTVVAGHDALVGTMAAVAGEFGFAPASSAEELLERDDLDCVYVATPPVSHVPLGRAVLDRGLPLFLEKPLAVDLASAEELVRLAEERGLPAVMNFPFATLPGLERFARELSDGTAGVPLRAELALHFSQWPRSWHTAGAWLAGDREGGFLREVFSHFAYLTQRLLGPLEVVSASVQREPGCGETRALAELRAGGVPLSLVGGVGGAAPDFNRWTLFCSERGYRVEDWSQVSVSSGDAWLEHELEAGETRGAESQLDALAALLRGGPSCLPTLAEGLGVMRAVEGVLAAGC